MKHCTLYALLIVFLICLVPNVHGAFFTRQHLTVQIPAVNNLPASQAGLSSSVSESVAVADVATSDFTALPRGRGNGRGSMKAFMLGWFCIIPVVALILAPFAFKNGIRNMGRKRKKRGLAIAGMVMATLGVAFTIAILIVA